jgi:uncharacterized membrane protein
MVLATHGTVETGYQGGPMLDTSPLQYLIFAALILFGLGFITFITGAVILIARSRNKDIYTVTQQTSQIMKKSLAEDVAGLVGNASALLTAMNDLARTQNGIGIILIIVGVILMFFSSYVLWYITFKAS